MAGPILSIVRPVRVEPLVQSYLAMIRSLESGAFRIEYPDLPGCSALATSFPDARRVAGSILDGHVRELMAQGIELPPPRTMKELRDAGECDGAFPTLVPVPSFTLTGNGASGEDS